MAERTGWEHYELENELVNSNMAMKLDMYRRESQKMSDLCVSFVKRKLSPEGEAELKEEIDLVQEGRVKIAISIVDALTNVRQIQNQVVPPRLDK